MGMSGWGYRKALGAPAFFGSVARLIKEILAVTLFGAKGLIIEP